MQPMKSLVLSGLISSFLVSAFLATAASAQDSSDNGPFDPSGTWAVGGGVEHVNFDKQQSAQELIEDSATALYFEGEYFFNRLFSTSFGMAFYSYDDNAAFSQWVEDWTGDEDYTSSDASGIPVYAEAGYKQFFGADGRTYITARGGLSLMLASERSISNCSDCREEDIEIDGGAYGALGAGVRLGNSFLLGVHYKHFFSGDIENASGISFSYNF